MLGIPYAKNVNKDPRNSSVSHTSKQRQLQSLLEHSRKLEFTDKFEDLMRLIVGHLNHMFPRWVGILLLDSFDALKAQSCHQQWVDSNNDEYQGP